MYKEMELNKNIDILALILLFVVSLSMLQANIHSYPVNTSNIATEVSGVIN